MFCVVICGVCMGIQGSSFELCIGMFCVVICGVCIGIQGSSFELHSECAGAQQNIITFEEPT